MYGEVPDHAIGYRASYSIALDPPSMKMAAKNVPTQLTRGRGIGYACSPHDSRPLCLRMKSFGWARDHGLSLALGVLFLVTMAGQTLTGYRVFNEDAREHGETPVSIAAYLASGHFYEATAENWESEFLQMTFYVSPPM
jgi:hypothetical protein